MDWDRGRYYIRSKKINGQVIRESMRKGFLGEVCALLDQDERALRLHAQEHDRLATCVSGPNSAPTGVRMCASGITSRIVSRRRWAST